MHWHYCCVLQKQRFTKKNRFLPQVRWPHAANAFQPAYGGGVNDGYVAKLNPAGSALIYSSYLGGTGYDSVTAITVDSSLNVCVTGYTDSANFPTVSSFQAARNGVANDAFATKIAASGAAISYSTYLGGNASDIAYDITVDAAGRAFVSGTTSSSNFPTTS